MVDAWTAHLCFCVPCVGYYHTHTALEEQCRQPRGPWRPLLVRLGQASAARAREFPLLSACPG